MADVQLEKGYTPVANEIIEQLVKLPLNGTQWRIIAVVWRYTYGFSRKKHKLSLNFIADAIGSPKSHVKEEVDSLIKKKVLIVEEEASFNRTRILSFNKDYTVYRLHDSIPIAVQDTIQDTGEYSNSSTKQYSNSSTKKSKNKIQNNIGDFFEQIWKLYPNKKGKGQISASKKETLYKIGLEEMTRCIDRYIKELKKDDWRKPQNGSTFFNSGYVDYLDANYQTDQVQEPLVRREIKIIDVDRDFIPPELREPPQREIKFVEADTDE